MISGDHAREGIVRRARQIQTPVVARYRDLRQGICAYLGDIMRPARTLMALEHHLQQRANDSALTTYSREDARASLEALAPFHRLANTLASFQFQAINRRLPPLMIEGVAVNVNPDLIVTQQSRGVDRFGVALLRMAKGDDPEADEVSPKRVEMGKIVASLAYMQASEMTHPEHELHYSLCLSIDVQSELVTPSSQHLSNRLKNIRAACRAISDQWSRP